MNKSFGNMDAFDGMPPEMIPVLLSAVHPVTGTLVGLVKFFEGRGIDPSEAVKHLGLALGFVAEGLNLDHHKSETQAWLCAGAAVVETGRANGLALDLSGEKAPTDDDRARADEMGENLLARMMANSRRDPNQKPN